MTTIKAPPQVILATLPELIERLRTDIRGAGGAVCVDLSQTTACDALGFQLIEAARAHAQSCGIALTLRVSAEVRAALARIGAAPQIFPHWYDEKVAA